MYDIFVVDHGNTQTAQWIKERFPHAQTVVPAARKSLYKHVARRAVTKHAWIVDDRYDYSNFDFDYTPPWHQAEQMHVWQQNTVLINCAHFLDTVDYWKHIQDFEFVHWHEDAISLQQLPNIFIWNFGGNDENVERLKAQYPDSCVLRYYGTHLEMMMRTARKAATEDFWILSSCCDYTNLDVAWKPTWEEESNIHCWASGSQKFGDTFYVSKECILAQADTVDKLEYVDSIHWHSRGYNRLPWPVNYISSGDIYSAVKNHKFSSIYEYFVAPGSTLGSTVDPCLWEKRHLIAYNLNGHVSLCPRDAIGGISARLLDYPHIQYHNCEKSTQKPQDIVFISYDEKNADLNYKILKDRFPQAQRIHGVKGNVNAYKAAAKLSSTPWYYAVFPKTEIDPTFDFDYHPNYLETPGHYIFYAHNRITDYAYGHGGVKMYHVKTTIEIENWGYDFTLSSPVTVIPVNSCYINPATAYEAWRTSFREVLKLKYNTTIEGRYRLHRWLTVGNGLYGDYSRAGAAAALEYNGDIKIANSWEWLREQFDSRYS